MARKQYEDPEITNAVEIARCLEVAAGMLKGAELEGYRAYLAEGMLRHAWEELRGVAEGQAVPFAFWGEMSRAADLMGAP